MATVSHESNLRITDAWEHSYDDSISTFVDKNTFTLSYDFDDGDGENEAQDMYRIRATLPTREEDAYDLAGGVTDISGTTLTFATVRQITVYNRSTVAGDNIIVGGMGSPTTGNLVTDLFDGDAEAGLKVRASGVFVVVAPLDGYTITGGSADVLRIYNDGVSASGITYDLIVKGTR